MNIEVNTSSILRSLDDLCKKEAENIKEFIENSGKYQSEVFEIKDNNKALSDENALNTDGCGLYVFVISNAVEIKKSKFDAVVYGAKLNSNFKGKHFNKGDCLYLGKSEKLLNNRINEHMESKDKKPYSLKLGADGRKDIKSSVSLYTFDLKSEFKKSRKILLSSVESYLHDFLKPKVGSKRS